MSKRAAGTQLTDRNWEDEEEPEDPGVFQTANEDVLKTRQIKTAKRRGPPSETTGAFKGFSGFGTKPASDTPAPTFKFGTTKNLPGLGVSNGDKPGDGSLFGAKGEKDEKKPGSGFTFGSPPAESSPPKSSLFSFGVKPVEGAGTGLGTKSEESKPFSFSVKPLEPAKPVEGSSSSSGFSFKGQTESTKTEEPKKNGSKSNAKYLAQLKGLNLAVTKWIKEHVDDNPYVVLTPIFTDYQKYIDEIEKDNPDHANESMSKTSTTNNETTASTVTSSVTESSSLFGAKKEGSTSSGFSLITQKPADSTDKPATSLFSFGSSSKSSGITGFSFKPDSDSCAGETKPFSFATGASAPAAANKEEDEEYVPPKPETVEIKEEGSLYTKRCKLFYQKDGAWKERGVGNLYLKPLNEKTQLLIRADNTLGTVLLNIMLSAAIPLKRQGKNNVSLFCAPNPPFDPKDESKPVSMLLRVKAAEDADELLAELEKHKS